jgi:hypothetical protein
MLRRPIDRGSWRAREECRHGKGRRVTLTETQLRECAARSATRMDLWVSLLSAAGARDVAEIGVYRGDYAAHLLRGCPGISRYFMVDPWRHLDDWNKPANKADDVFERFFREAMDRTSPHAARRVVLRGKTSEVIDQIPDDSLDFAYVDGDHTLRGITIDLVNVYPKIRKGGWIGGDDFCRSIWQHEEFYEPTLVFPFAVYFAEAVAERIYGLPHNQFLLEKGDAGGYEFVDLTGAYVETDLRTQLDGRGDKPADRPVSLRARVRRRLRI